jgi:hypothetical protein
MAKSRIIKDLANGSVDIYTAMKRLKILLMDFPNPEIEKWVNYELNGYPHSDTLPKYRIYRGEVIASFFVGYAKYTGTRISISHLPENIQKLIVECYVTNSLSSIISMKDNKEYSTGKNLSPDIYNELCKGSNIDSIISATVNITKNAPIEILVAVENKLLEILYLLEKEFGVLDDLDIDMNDKSEEQIDDISSKIVNIIYIDNSVTIGNDNKISNSHFET